jgi:hypothetical protein
VDGRGHLKSLKKDLLLSLHANVLGPSHEARQITSLGLLT